MRGSGESRSALALVVGIQPHGGAPGLLLALVALVGEQAKLGAARTASFLPAELGDSLRFFARGAGDLRCNFVQKKFSCEVPIEPLGALSLTFDPNACRPME